MTGLLALAFAAGMVAPVNPCGFALLPGWIALTLGDTQTSSLSLRLARALRAGLALTLGFTGTLVIVGLIVSAGARALIRLAPQIGLATGLALLLLAVLMLTGRSLPLRLPGRLGRRTTPGPVTGHSLAYGIGFAAASLSCTFGILLAVIAQAQATATYAGQLVVFSVYAGGAATVLLLLAIATAVVGSTLSRPMARLARHGPRLQPGCSRTQRRLRSWLPSLSWSWSSSWPRTRLASSSAGAARGHPFWAAAVPDDATLSSTGHPGEAEQKPAVTGRSGQDRRPLAGRAARHDGRARSGRRNEMIGAKTPALRFKGSGDKLRLRVTTVPDPLANVRECCRASVAVEKALGEAIRGALSAGHSWAEIGTALGVEGESSASVREQYPSSRRFMHARFWGSGEEGGR